MSDLIAALKVKLTVDAAQYEAGLANARKGMQEFARDVASFATGSLLAGGIQAAGAGLASLGQQAYEASASYERLALSLQALSAKELVNTGQAVSLAAAQGRAAEQAQELLKWNQQLAIKSPFSQEGVAQAFRMAQAYGFTAKESQRMTAALIDFTSATGQTESTMKRIALALGQVQAKGRLMGGEVLQLTEAGLGVRQILAEAFGKTTEEIVEMQERGLIPAKAAIDAILGSLEQDFGGAAAKQSETLAGLANSFQDLFTVNLRELTGGALAELQPVFANLINTLNTEEFQGKMREMGKGIASFAVDTITTVSSVAETLGRLPEAATRVTETLGALMPAGTLDMVQGLANGLTQNAIPALILLSGAAGAYAVLQGPALILSFQASVAAAAQAAAAYIAANAALLPFAASIGLVAIAWAGVAASYNNYQSKLQEGATNVLAETEGNRAAAEALQERADASKAAQQATQEQADALAQLQQAQQQATKDLADQLAGMQAFGASQASIDAAYETGIAKIKSYDAAIQEAAGSMSMQVGQAEHLGAATDIYAAAAMDAANRTKNQSDAAIVAAAAMEEAAAKDVLAATNSQILALEKDRLAGAAQAAANAVLAGGGNIEAEAARLAASSSLVDQLTAAFIRLNMAQAAAGSKGPMTGQKLNQMERDSGQRNPFVPLSQTEKTQQYVADLQLQATATQNARKSQVDLAAAERNRIMTLGSQTEKTAVLRAELAKLPPGTAAYVNKLTELEQAEARAGKAGSARASEAEKANNKLVEIQERAAERLLEIERRAAEQRAEAARALAADILTTSADMVAEQERNDLELAGMEEEELRKRIPRERAEAEARVRMAEEVQAAREMAANGDAELAQKTLDLQTEAIGQRQELDQEYYERQAELAGNPEALAVLQTQYDEALAAQQQATDVRIELAQQQAEQAALKAQEEKAAVVAAAAEQAAEVKGASESQRDAVVNALAAQASAANSWASSTSSAVDKVVDAASRAAGAIAKIPSIGSSSGGGSAAAGSTNGGGGGTRAAGGGTFLTAGPILVGDNPGGVELVTVTPISGKGRTTVGNGTLRMAGGGGAILDPSTGTNPALQLLAGGGSSGNGGGGGGDPAAEAAAIAANYEALRALELSYLDEKRQRNEREFQADLQADLQKRQAERERKRAQDAQEDALDAERSAYEEQLIAAARAQATEQTAKRLAEADASVQADRNAELGKLDQEYQQKTAEIVGQGSSAQNDIQAFWARARLADAQAQYQEERQAIVDEYAQRAEEVQRQVEQGNSDIEAELVDAAKKQAEAAFQARYDALEDAQFVEDQITAEGYRQREETLKGYLKREEEIWKASWEARFAALAGGEELLDQLKDLLGGVLTGDLGSGSGGPVMRPGSSEADLSRVVANNQRTTTGRSFASSDEVAVMVQVIVQGSGPVNKRDAEEAGYRGAKRALTEVGKKAYKKQITGGT